jgi:ABC-type antimicrobial peptide transport system permease subunit
VALGVRAVFFAIVFVAVVIGIGGIFGVMNTMFAAISQRIKDVGVLRILGFARWQILVSFFLESLAIALLGGLIGCALGSLCHGVTATSIVSGGQGGGKSVILTLTVDASTLAIGLLFTLIMGALGGLLPSFSAMRLRPLEALR